MAIEMKNSGVQWIGEVPNHWTRAKIKNVCSFIGSGTTPSSNNNDYYDGDVFWIQSGDLYRKSVIKDTEKKVTSLAVRTLPALKIYKSPFAVVAMYGASVGNISISDIDACTNQACCVLKPSDDIFLKFLFYWIECCKPDFLTQAEGGGQPNISQTKIKNQAVLVPPLQEQEAIANFLDEKCAEIDGLLADLEEQIRTLRAYEKSLIAETVTHGLNPDATMKATGLGWVDYIPEHWKLEKFKHHLSPRRVTGCSDKQVLSVYREFGVIPKDSRDDNHNVTSDDTSKYKYVRVNDFVINKMKAWQGSMGVSLYEGIVSPAYFVYSFSDDAYFPRYFNYLMRNANYIPEYRRLSGGIREGQWDLSPYELGKLLIIIPPIEEQIAIANYLDDKIARIEDLIGDKFLQTLHLKEYKSSLIYEYVTGKKQLAL